MSPPRLVGRSAYTNRRLSARRRRLRAASEGAGFEYWCARARICSRDRIQSINQLTWPGFRQRAALVADHHLAAAAAAVVRNVISRAAPQKLLLGECVVLCCAVQRSTTSSAAHLTCSI